MVVESNKCNNDRETLIAVYRWFITIKYRLYI